MERGLTIHQRGLVDASIEEGEILAAIFLLDQMRAPEVRPPISHLQQLLYICLRPIPEDEEPAKFTPSHHLNASFSPRKLARKTHNFFTPSVTTAAQTLLMSYTLTNTPETIGLALPNPSRRPSPDEAVDAESLLAHNALCIPKARTCWEILRAGFTRTPSNPTAASKSIGNKSHNRNLATGVEEPFGTLQDDAPISVEAWKVLEWLLTLFERDEEQNNASAPLPEPFSNLLVKQLAFTHGQHVRWEFDQPLSIVFYAIKQTSPHKRCLAARLLKLLVHTASAPEIDSAALLTSILRRLPSLSHTEVLDFFLLFGSSLRSLRLKIILCYNLIAGSTVGQLPRNASARSQPRALRRNQSRNENTGSTRPGSRSSVLPDLLPNVANILSTLTIKSNTLFSHHADETLQMLKLILIEAYGTWNMNQSADLQNREWIDMVRSGDVRRRLTSTLDTLSGKHAYIISMLDIWEQMVKE